MPTAREERRPTMRAALAAAAALALSAAPAAAALRCGSSLISPGDHKLKVLHECGPPTLVENRGYQYRTYLPYISSVEAPTQFVGGNVEEWTYNFGPRRFMRLVRFSDGEVVRIISLDYGY